MSKFVGCPFCGANPHHGLTKVEYDQLHGEPFQRFRIHCPRGHATVTEASEEYATKVWNTRATTPTPSELVEALRNIREKASQGMSHGLTADATCEDILRFTDAALSNIGEE